MVMVMVYGNMSYVGRIGATRLIKFSGVLTLQTNGSLCPNT